MKVGYVTAGIGRSGGGVAAAVKSLSLAVAAFGRELHVLGLEEAEIGQRPPAWDGIAVQTFPTRGHASFGYAPTFMKVLRRVDADVVHRHGLWMYPSVVVGRWQDETGRPVIISPHGMLDPWALRNSAWKKRVASVLFERRCLEGAACIHALNMAEASAIRGYDLSIPIAVVPNGVDLPDESAIPSEPPWMGHVPQDSRVLLFLGRIHPKKGMSELLTAFAAAHRAPEATSWHLVVIGWDDGEHEAELRRRTERLGLSPRVHWLGPRFGEEKTAAFANSDAFVLASHSEGLPMAVLEAWSYGRPVLMTEGCNLPEGFAAGAAHCVHTEPERLAEDLCGFFRLDPVEQARMGERGRELVKARYTWPRVAVRMIEVYNWVVGDGPRPQHVLLADC